MDVNTMMQLRTYIYTKNPGDTVNITHAEKDGGKLSTIPVKIAAKEKDDLITR